MENKSWRISLGFQVEVLGREAEPSQGMAGNWGPPTVSEDSGSRTMGGEIYGDSKHGPKPRDGLL
jgi:hypothetical protein